MKTISALTMMLLWLVGVPVAAWISVPPPMVVAAWNYAPDASVSPVKQAVQAYFDFSDAARNHKWERRRITWYVDGKEATAQRAAARLMELPVLTWAHPYHLSYVDGAPPAFSPESIDAHKQLIASARRMLRESGLSEHRCDRLFHITDFEAFTPYTKIPLVPGAAFAVQADHASTACHLFGQALAECSWDTRGTGAANYHTCHGPHPFVAGGLPNNRATPCHVPGSMDGRTTFISLYSTGGPWGCLTEAESLDAIRKAQPGSWLVVEDYQPGRGNIIRAAQASGRIRLLVLWGTVEGSVPDGKHRDTVPADHPKQPDKTWQKQTDAAIAAELR